MRSVLCVGLVGGKTDAKPVLYEGGISRTTLSSKHVKRKRKNERGKQLNNLKMRQSIFKQSFLTKGKVKTVNGELVVTMNYTTKTIKGTHAVTHDDFTKQAPQHKIEAFVEGKLWDKQLELDSELMVENEVEQMKDKLEKHLETVANSEPVKSFVEKMQELGFK